MKIKKYQIGNIFIYRMKDYHLSLILSGSYKIDDNHLLIVSISWNCSNISLKKINELNEIYKNIVILTNTEEECQFLKERTKNIDILFCNSNSFINENSFIYDKTIEKKYNMVINSKFKKYKNVHLAKNIDNIVHIGYDLTNDNNSYIPDFGFIANFTDNNYKSLSQKEITTIINSSNIGGIFSKEEGACYASTEYLLCGIPVLSTKSKGGRDIWYNEENSIVCEPEDIDESYRQLKYKLENGFYDSIKIRNGCLKIMEEHRTKLANYLYDKLNELNIPNIPDITIIKGLFSHFNNNKDS